MLTPRPVRDPDLTLLLDLAKRAGDMAQEHLGQVRRQLKRGEEAVTWADRAVQHLIVTELTKRFPKDGIIGEENDDGTAITYRAPADGNQRVWVIDPIDGTNNYIATFGAFAVCIGLLDRGFPAMGVVYDVTRKEAYLGKLGAGAWVVSSSAWRQVRVLDTAPGPQSLLMLTSNLLIDGHLQRWGLRLLTMTPWKVRMLGSAALECVQVGAGIAHFALTLNGKLWDVAAPAAVVLAAGGRVTNYVGTDLFPFNLAGYDGGKVPFIATARLALQPLVAELNHQGAIGHEALC